MPSHTIVLAKMATTLIFEIDTIATSRVWL